MTMPIQGGAAGLTWEKIKEKLQEEGALNKQYDANLDAVIDAEHIYRPNIFGDGSDGDVIISTDVILTSDKNFNSLVIYYGCTLSTNGYTLRVKNTLINYGTIDSGAPSGGGAGGVANPGCNNGDHGVDGTFGGGGGGGAGGAGYCDLGCGQNGSGGAGGDGTPHLRIYAYKIENYGTIKTNDGTPGYAGEDAPATTACHAGSGGGGGGGGGAGNIYLVYAALYPRGTLSPGHGAAGGAGGAGGTTSASTTTICTTSGSCYRFGGGSGSANGGSGGAGGCYDTIYCSSGANGIAGNSGNDGIVVESVYGSLI